MSKHDEHPLKIEAGQILNPENFPVPNELVCIQVPKVFDQVSLRACEPVTITLHPAPGNPYPKYTFQNAGNFNIESINIVKETDSMSRPGFKKLQLSVLMGFTVSYLDGTQPLTTDGHVNYNLTVYEIYCPNCTTQIGVTGYPQYPGFTADEDGTLIKVEAIAEAFHDTISGNTLSLEIGSFFVVKCECVVQLLIPAYGYCPVPPEQHNINPSTLDCKTFNDRTRIPFPTKFFPDQKWNPLDRCKREVKEEIEDK